MKKGIPWWTVITIITLIFGLVPQHFASADDQLRDDLDELSDRIDEVEKQTLRDKVDISAEIRARFDDFSFTDNKEDISESTNIISSTRIRLNLYSDITKRLKFNARLVSMYNWGTNDPGDNAAGGATRTPSDNSIRFERAYMDYFFESLPLAITIGRLPTTDGLPTHLRENTPRKSSHAGITYDKELDGIAVSLDLSRLLKLPGASLKMIHSDTVTAGDVSPEGVEDSDALLNSLPLYLLQFETGFPGILDQMLMIVNWHHVRKISPPTLSQMAELYDVENELTPEEMIGDIPESLGTMDSFTFYIQADRFLNSWVDCFFGISYKQIIPSGDPAVYFPGTSFERIVSINNSQDNSDTLHATVFHIGARLNLPFEPLNQPKLGIEFNSASKHTMPKSEASEDPLHKLDVLGDAFDIYYIQPIDRNFFVRVGYTHLQVNYSNEYRWFGPPVEEDIVATNTYLLLDMKF